MIILDQLKKGERSLRFLAWGTLAGLAVLAVGLWRVQVLSGARYREKQEGQSFRTVRVPAQRGRILDRTGRALAENQPRYRLDVYLDELRPQFEAEFQKLRTNLVAQRGGAAGPEPGLWTRVAARFSRVKKKPLISSAERIGLARQARYAVLSGIISQVNTRLGANVQKTEADLFKHWSEKRALPFPLLDNLSPTQVALATEQGWSIPGVELELQPVRSYPNGRAAAHVLGYLRKEDTFDEEERGFDYRLRDYQGATGLEAALDPQLRGRAGAKSILVNSAGYRHRQGEIILAEPQPGQDVHTTIDLEVQKVAEASLDKVSADERGAVVVMDPQNGDVLALASAPAFDPAMWINPITPADLEKLLDPKMKPLFNRATYGKYNPGSTFKIVTSLALLDAGILNQQNLHEKFTVYDKYRLGSRLIDDTAPPGEYDFERAFVRSSNSYFIDYSLKLGLKRLLEMGHRFHLGELTGVRIPEEKKGDFPEFDAVENVWSRGNLANVCIGQEITATPLQMAVLVSAVANGGKVFYPRLVDRIESPDLLSDRVPDRVRPGQLRSEIGVKKQHLDLVRAAMRADVASDEGSGKRARVEGFEVCGKTGTAEVKQGGRLIDKITWFVSYAPYDNPRYAVVVMIESGGSGGGTCAPVAKRIYEFLKEREQGGRNRSAAVGLPGGPGAGPGKGGG